jgi:hypothetical protein
MVTTEEIKESNDKAKRVLREIKAKLATKELVRLHIKGINGYVEVAKEKYESDKEYYDNMVKNGIPLEYKQYRGHGYGQQ